ncbi:MAG: HD domain-containing phosphohydrolase [Myxococcota bacterium]
MADRVARPRVLCVDDEPNVLDGLALHLRRRYDPITATSGAAGLDALERDPSIAVILTDMRMPGMDGAAFLGRARRIVPDAVRILLTGQADLHSAIAAVNDGQIFRFLQKPCPPTDLMAAVDAAAELYRLVTTERVLLEQTLHGSIKTLIDVLALANPVAFGRANRLKQLATDLAVELGLTERWQLEVAAMLSPLGTISLEPGTIDKLHHGHTLSDAEEKAVARVHTVTDHLLANIPRLEAVRAILLARGRSWRQQSTAPDAAERFGQVLRVATDFDDLEVGGSTPALALSTMRGRERYDPAVLDALHAIRGGDDLEDVRELPLAGLRAGMVLAEDVKLTSGTLLVVRGYEVTAGFLERTRHFRPGTVREPLRVIVRRNNKDPVMA